MGRVEAVPLLIDVDATGPTPRAYTHLPRNVLDAVDRRAEDLGISRSALIRLAVLREVGHAAVGRDNDA